MIQSCLCDLEERLNILRNESDSRLGTLSSERDQLVKELVGVKEERDALSTAKGEAENVVEELKQQMSAKSAELEEERDARAKEKEEARQEADLILLQLHQVQQELEDYFVHSRAQDKILSKYREQTIGFGRIISELASGQF